MKHQNFDKKLEKMKFSLALLGAALANSDDKKFVNKSKFMTSSPPRWWSKETPEARYGNIQVSLDNIFNRHFPGTIAEQKLKPLLEDLHFDAGRIEGGCEPGKINFHHTVI